MKRLFGLEGSSGEVERNDTNDGKVGSKTQQQASTEPTASLPLSGAQVFIVTDDYVKQREMRAFIEALGGRTPHNLENATHGLWATTKAVSSGDSHRDLTINKDMQKQLKQCQKLNIPVVETSWLERISGLQDGERWSDVNVDPYLSPIGAMISILDDEDEVDDDGDVRMGGVTVETVDNDDEERTAGTQEESVDYTLETVVETVTENVIEVGLRWRRDGIKELGRSIAQTFAVLTREEPDKMEEEAIRRAMELSLLDCALVYRKPDQPGGFFSAFTTSTPKPKEQTPHEILGVVPTATPKEIKTAYRKLALVHHPGKKNLRKSNSN